MELFTFEAGDEYLGIEAKYIYRVVDEVKVTPVPLVPPCYAGVLYYRGELFDVTHVGSLLGQRETIVKGNPLIILLKWPHKKLALILNRIIGLIWIEDINGKKIVYTREGNTMRIITPDEIWESLSELTYGPYKV
jgi:chemotaxis signal transduction protein